MEVGSWFEETMGGKEGCQEWSNPCNWQSLHIWVNQEAERSSRSWFICFFFFQGMVPSSLEQVFPPQLNLSGKPSWICLKRCVLRDFKTLIVMLQKYKFCLTDITNPLCVDIQICLPVFKFTYIFKTLIIPCSCYLIYYI